MRQPITRTIAPTDGWAALAPEPLSARILTIFAIGDTVQLRRSGDDAAGNAGKIPDGSNAVLTNIDLNQVEINVPAEAEASIIASPH